jgi:hypothetical protein
MDTLPTEVKGLICDYAFKCKRGFMPIDKEFTEILSTKFQNCSEIHVLNRYLCRACDRQVIRDVNMVFQCYLPLYR